MGNTDIFEMMANRYDTSERIHIAKVAADAIRECLADTENKNAIDFGCGTGLVGMNLLKEFKSILFLDSSQNMINRMKQKITDFNIKNADTMCFDIETDEKLDLHMDYIFMAQVLLHIKDVDLVLSKLYDTLNTGGHLIIVDFDKNEAISNDMVHNGFDQKNLTELMNRIGYREVHSKTFYSGSKIFMDQDASMFVLDAKK
ncbi:MAG: class I SAM-dependent methyltransferase [Mobilitalea sp.]